LFTIGTITLQKLQILIAISANLEFGNDGFTFNLLHTPSKIPIYLNPIRIKVHDSKIIKWTLLKKVQVKNLNLGIEIKPHMVKINVNLDSQKP